MSFRLSYNLQNTNSKIWRLVSHILVYFNISLLCTLTNFALEKLEHFCHYDTCTFQCKSAILITRLHILLETRFRNLHIFVYFVMVDVVFFLQKLNFSSCIYLRITFAFVVLFTCRYLWNLHHPIYYLKIIFRIRRLIYFVCKFILAESKKEPQH